LATAASGPLADYVAAAQLTRAEQEVSMLAASVVRLCSDVGAERTRSMSWMAFDLLVGAGRTPVSADSTTFRWVNADSAWRVGHLDAHLVTNAAGYSERDVSAETGWRGPYVSGSIHADPWGRRYAVNAAIARAAHGAVMVVSAGADGIVQTPFAANSGFGDDVVATIFSRGCLRQRQGRTIR
jgi:hypothetical protein